LIIGYQSAVRQTLPGHQPTDQQSIHLEEDDQ
jgi:hypothetical protein